jgi:hypothetical protein
MPAPARTELLSAGAVSGLKFRKSSFFCEESLRPSLGRGWRELAIGDLQLAIVDCRVLIDGGGCCNTSFSISNQAAAAGHSPITDHQSPIGNENLVFRCGRRPRCLD